MSKIETLTAYKCAFSYLQRNNPLKEELKNKIKDGELPDYTFSNFVDDYSKFTSDLAVILVQIVHHFMNIKYLCMNVMNHLS